MTSRDHVPHNFTAPETLANGKYVIQRLLGQGAMGVVYEALHPALQRRVAIKLLHTSVTLQPQARERFRREALAASRIEHPNSTRVIDFGEEDGVCYIVMEFLDGQSLGDILEKEEALPVERAVWLLSQVLSALMVAHKNGIIHRDLKPDNVVVVQSINEQGLAEERAKVCDFGIAKLHGLDGDGTLTQDGAVSGTPHYMSPEQCQGKTLDARSDLYSCGVLLYRMLTGVLPFSGENPFVIIYAQVTETAAPASQIRPELGPKIDAFLATALAKDPARRFQNAREMRAHLRGLTSEADTEPGLAPVELAPVELAPVELAPVELAPVELAPVQLSVANQGDHASAASTTAANPAVAEATVNQGGDTSGTGWTAATTDGGGRRHGESDARWRWIAALAAIAAAFAIWGLARAGGRPDVTQSASRVMTTVALAEPKEVASADGDAAREEPAPKKPAREEPAPKKPAREEPAPVEPAPVEPAQAQNQPLEAQSPPPRARRGSRRGWRSRRRRDSSRGKGRKRDAAAGVESRAKGVQVAAEAAATEVAAPAVIKPAAPPEPATPKPTSKPAAIEVVLPAPEPVTPKLPPFNPNPRIGWRRLRIDGGMSRNVVVRALARLPLKSRQCWLSAAKPANTRVRTTVKLTFIVDEDGRFRHVVGGGGPTGLAPCVATHVGRLRSRVRPDTGTVSITTQLVFEP